MTVSLMENHIFPGVSLNEYHRLMDDRLLGLEAKLLGTETGKSNPTSYFFSVPEEVVSGIEFIEQEEALPQKYTDQSRIQVNTITLARGLYYLPDHHAMFYQSPYEIGRVFSLDADTDAWLRFYTGITPSAPCLRNVSWDDIVSNIIRKGRNLNITPVFLSRIYHELNQTHAENSKPVPSDSPSGTSGLSRNEISDLLGLADSLRNTDTHYVHDFLRGLAQDGFVAYRDMEQYDPEDPESMRNVYATAALARIMIREAGLPFGIMNGYRQEKGYLLIDA